MTRGPGYLVGLLDVQRKESPAAVEKVGDIRGTREECAAQLKALKEVILGTEYRLDRCASRLLLMGTCFYWDL